MRIVLGTRSQGQIAVLEFVRQVSVCVLVVDKGLCKNGRGLAVSFMGWFCMVTGGWLRVVAVVLVGGPAAVRKSGAGSVPPRDQTLDFWWGNALALAMPTLED